LSDGRKKGGGRKKKTRQGVSDGETEGNCLNVFPGNQRKTKVKKVDENPLERPKRTLRHSLERKAQKMKGSGRALKDQLGKKRGT